jgi:hypothetical protein
LLLLIHGGKSNLFLHNLGPDRIARAVLRHGLPLLLLLSNTWVSANTDRQETQLSSGSTPAGVVGDYLSLTRFDHSSEHIVWSGTMSCCADSSGEDWF